MKYGLIFFFVEAFILSGATNTGATAVGNAQTYLNYLNGTPPTAPNTTGCSSVWWNPLTWGCSVSNLAAVIWYYGAVASFYLEQIGSSLLIPFVMIGAVATYSSQYWWLAVINAVVIVVMAVELAHGLI